MILRVHNLIKSFSTPPYIPRQAIFSGCGRRSGLFDICGSRTAAPGGPSVAYRGYTFTYEESGHIG
jgi:hypothetical protein